MKVVGEQVDRCDSCDALTNCVVLDRYIEKHVGTLCAVCYDIYMREEL